MKNKQWFCEECHILMEQKGDFAKCPVCGAEVWHRGEGQYRREMPGADIAVKIHGRWFCQNCRTEMEPITEDFAKCPHCAAEVWYGKTPHEVRRREEHLTNDADERLFTESQGHRVRGDDRRQGGARRQRQQKRKRERQTRGTKETHA